MSDIRPLIINGINNDKKERMINCILTSKGITRQALAARCGVSAMTSGKVVRAMIDSKYATVSRERNESGSLAEIIYPSKSFRFLIFDISEEMMSAELYNISDELLFSYSQPKDASISSDIETQSFIENIKVQLSEDFDAHLCKSALIYSEKKSLPDNIDIDIVIERKAAINEYVKATSNVRTAIFIGGNSPAEITLISNGEGVYGKTKPICHAISDIHSELDLMSYLSARLYELFHIVIPEQIFIDRDKLCTTRRFAKELEDILSARCGIEKEKLPEIITNDGISFASRAVIGQLTEIYSKLLCGQ